MKKIQAFGFILTALILALTLSVCQINIAYAAPSRARLRAVRDLDGDALTRRAIDAFRVVYEPVSETYGDEYLSTVYVYASRGFGLINRTAENERLTVIRDGGFVYALDLAENNPYEPRLRDGSDFAKYLANPDKILSDMGIAELDASMAYIVGRDAPYRLLMSETQKLSAVRLPAGDKERDRIDFVYNGSNGDAVAAVMRAYDKAAWAAVKNARDSAVALELMGYVFTVKPGINPFGPEEATGFEKAAQYAKSAASQAYLSDAGADSLGINKRADSLDFNFRGSIETDKILIDAAGKPLFPMSFLARSLGYKLTWNSPEKTFLVTNGDSLIAAKKIESSYTLSNYKTAKHSICSIIDNKVYVDLGFVINTLNCELNYDGDKTVTAGVRLR
jgi:hypothetical protein